ncbi:MAG: alkaline phosphatase family protein [Actinomycetota bacterium]
MWQPHTRRTFLGRSILGASSALLAACSKAIPGSDLRQVSPIPMGTAPESVDASRFATQWPIKHVVILMKENRTFDHMYGRFPGSNGVTVGIDKGRERPLARASDGAVGDIEHCYPCALDCLNGGEMDGFNRDDPAERNAYTQFWPHDLPNYWHWAQEYALADNFFTSALGPSFPNHLYMIAAQSGGAHDNPVQDVEELRRRHRRTGLFKPWGCDSIEGAYIEIDHGESGIEEVFPCFEFDTVGDLLDREQIPWAYYSAAQNQNGYLWSAYDAIHHYRADAKLWRSRVFPVDNLVRDIHDGLLPPVTWVTPRFEVSDHPGYSLCHGENWTTEVVNAVMQSPMWRDTAIFITWDDYGGFYDHVRPPELDRFGLGFRVPLLVLSPYAKRGAVTSELGEFSSLARFIEDNWGLPQLTERDRLATPMLSAFDFTQPPRPPDVRPARTDCKGPEYPATTPAV